MVHLFFDGSEEPTQNLEEQKLTQLQSLLQTYNLIPHDNQESRSESLQAILKHLENMTPTPTLDQWIEDNLIDHLTYYEFASTKRFTNPGPS
jgi:hypothetical protein